MRFIQMVRFVIVSATMINQSTAADRCDVKQKFLCNQTGCQSTAPTIFSRIDTDQRTYSRCDQKGCDDYQAAISRSGDFMLIALPERGLLAKVSLSNGGFLEVATLGLDAYVSYGQCRADAD